jgi:hypothetical protein
MYFAIKQAYKLKSLPLERLCDPDWIRTNDPPDRIGMLYPAELINDSIYFLLFILLIYNSMLRASTRLENASS